MKPAERVLDVTSNLVGEKIAMTIDVHSVSKIMTVLTDLYSDQEMAVIREYSTNAWDAHIEAGMEDVPIEVSLPGPLSPTFRVRDYGYGLDVEDIRDIYSRYGTSTKESSNDYVGMLGLGCKSALTYTDQFTLTGIKNGVATQVSISRDANGAGSMTIVSQYETDEPSGVEVSVPARAGNQFAQKAQEFFRFWVHGGVVVNGKQPEKISGMWIANDILLTKEVKRPMIVMGNVAYPDPTAQSYGYGYSYSYHHPVAFVDIGEVHFTPSREALLTTQKTKETIEVIRLRVEKETNDALLKIIANAPTAWDAVQQVRLAKPLGHEVGTGKWRGKLIPNKIEAEKDTKFVTVNGQQGYSKYSWSASEAIYLDQYAEDTTWVIGYESDNFTPYKKQKFDQWASKRNKTHPTKYVLCSIIPKDLEDWINPKNVLLWADIDAEKIKKDSNTGVLRSGRPSGSYAASVNGTFTDKLLAKDIDTKIPLFWIQGNRWTTSKNLTWVRKKNSDATIVFLPENRINKFKRDFPMVQNVTLYCKDLAEKWLKGLTEDTKAAMNISQSGNVQLYQKLDETRIHDEWLRYTVAMSKVKVLVQMDEYNFYRTHGVEVTSKWMDQLSDRFPLLSYRAGYGAPATNLEHAYIYIDAVIAANKKDSNKEVSNV